MLSVSFLSELRNLFETKFNNMLHTYLHFPVTSAFHSTSFILIRSKLKGLRAIFASMRRDAVRIIHWMSSKWRWTVRWSKWPIGRNSIGSYRYGWHRNEAVHRPKSNSSAIARMWWPRLSRSRTLCWRRLNRAILWMAKTNTRATAKIWRICWRKSWASIVSIICSNITTVGTRLSC